MLNEGGDQEAGGGGGGGGGGSAPVAPAAPAGGAPGEQAPAALMPGGQMPGNVLQITQQEKEAIDRVSIANNYIIFFSLLHNGNLIISFYIFHLLSAVLVPSHFY